MSQLGDKPLPPYVMFEYRAVEDRAASIETGSFASKDVLFALITPRGSKDRVERPADEWLAHVREQAAQGRIPEEWPELFQRRMEAFVKNEELPESGTPVKNWRAASPGQVRALITAGVTTVEALAQANEECLARIGLGSRGLKNLAVNWVQSQEKGIPASRLTALETENTALKDRLADMGGKLDALTKQLELLQGKS